LIPTKYLQGHLNLVVSDNGGDVLKYTFFVFRKQRLRVAYNYTTFVQVYKVHNKKNTPSLERYLFALGVEN
jgi:hypothetical protein